MTRRITDAELISAWHGEGTAHQVAHALKMSQQYLYDRWRELQQANKLPNVSRRRIRPNTTPERSPHDRIEKPRETPGEGCYSKADLPQAGDGFDGRPLPYDVGAFDVDPLLARLIRAHGKSPRTDLPAFMMARTTGSIGA